MSGNFSPPPIKNPIALDDGLVPREWAIFFNNLFQGDSGTSWTPVFTNLGQVGPATATGAYYKSGRFIEFVIVLTPGTNTSSAAGTTYVDLPFSVAADGPCTATTGANSSLGAVTATGRCYPPSWTNLTTVITIQGRVLAK